MKPALYRLEEESLEVNRLTPGRYAFHHRHGLLDIRLMQPLDTLELARLIRSLPHAREV